MSSPASTNAPTLELSRAFHERTVPSEPSDLEGSLFLVLSFFLGGAGGLANLDHVRIAVCSGRRHGHLV